MEMTVLGSELIDDPTRKGISEGSYGRGLWWN